MHYVICMSMLLQQSMTFVPPASLDIVVLCCAVLCCAVLCCAVLCCAVLCCVVLCCVVLCCVVLCCVVLCVEQCLVLWRRRYSTSWLRSRRRFALGAPSPTAALRCTAKGCSTHRRHQWPSTGESRHRAHTAGLGSNTTTSHHPLQLGPAGKYKIIDNY